MEFSKIKEESTIHPGEYLLHKPTNKIVVCGAFKREEGTIRYLAGTVLGKDEIANFRRIHLSQPERKMRAVSRCKGCGG